MGKVTETERGEACDRTPPSPSPPLPNLPTLTKSIARVTPWWLLLQPAYIIVLASNLILRCLYLLVVMVLLGSGCSRMVRGYLIGTSILVNY